MSTRIRLLLLVAAFLAAAACAGTAAPAVAPGWASQPVGTFFQGAGVLVVDATAFTAARAPVLAADHFRWVALHLASSLTLDQSNLDQLDSGWADGLRARGLGVCGWGSGGAYPAQEAALADRLIRRYHLACYILDAEAAYMGTGYGGDPSRSAQFVDAFRKLQPTLAAAVTTMGGAYPPFTYPFDYDVWRDHGFDLLPQAYLSVSTAFSPARTLADAVRAGYPPARVHPMIGIGFAQGRAPLTGAQYAPLLAKAGTTGFSVYLGERATDADFAALGAAIARQHIAR